jgi:UDP-N-acetylglucosamine 2-epimerase (non-hydrolysing)
MKVLNVVGARPNFMKIAPIVEEMKKTPDLDSVLVHTGQHYDEGMSDVFFRDLGIPVPDVHLETSTWKSVQAPMLSKRLVLWSNSNESARNKNRTSW